MVGRRKVALHHGSSLRSDAASKNQSPTNGARAQPVCASAKKAEEEWVIAGDLRLQHQHASAGDGLIQITKYKMRVCFG